MASGPMQNPAEQSIGDRVIPAKPTRQRRCFRRAEVVQLDPPPNIKGGHSRVANEVSRSGHAQQPERQPMIRRLSRTAVIELPDSSEKLIGRKLEAADDVDFVDKDYDFARKPRQDHLLDAGNPALQRPPFGVLLAKIKQFILQVQLLAQTGD